MARVVLVCTNPSELTLLQACLKGDDVASVKVFKDAARALTQAKPDLVVARLDPKNSTGMDVLHMMKRGQILAPVVVVLPLRGTALENEAWQLGVRTYVTLPIRYDEFRKAVEKTRQVASQKDEDGDPAVTEVERGGNLSGLVNELTRDMKCPAGTNRVLIRSVISGINEKSEPRICLRCPVRQAVGLNEYVYYEHIRDYCTGKPKKCEAVIQYKRLRKANG